MAISIGGIVITKLLADRAGIQPDRVGQLMLFGGLLGYSPVGIVVTNQLIQQEAANETQITPAPTPTTTTPGANQVQVPDVRNQTLTAAQGQLISLGLKAQALNAFSTSVQKGLVIGQTPAPGATVPLGSTVILTISQGISLPDVTGQFIEPARSALLTLGLQVQTVPQRDPASIDIVIAENPAPGLTVSPGSTVTLTVSQGPNISVPNVVQTRISHAKKILTDAGLVVNQVNQSSSSVNKDFVISQDPPAGASALPGDTVTLTVSTGEGVQVPDVAGLAVKAAQDALKAVGLNATVKNESSAAVVAGFVIRQDPEANQTVAPGTTITLVVSQGSAGGLFDLPDFTGQMYTDVREILQDQEIKQKRKDVSSKEPAGTVVDQDPKAGKIKRDTIVNLMVSTGIIETAK